MVAAPRTLENALLDSKPILRQVALTGDALIDAAAINAAMPDDAAKRAAQKAQQRMDISAGGTNALFNAVNTQRQKQPGTLSFVGGDDQGVDQMGSPRQMTPEQQRRAMEDQPTLLDQGMNVAQTALGYGVFVPLATDMALPMVGGALGWMGWKGAKDTLNAPKNWMQKTHITKNLNMRQAVNDGIQIGFTAIQTYGVAKGFSDNMAALKEMYTDITGKPAPSTMEMLTGDVPPLLAEARSHFIKEYGTRGLIQVAGWGLMIRDLMHGKYKKPEEIEAGRIGFVSGIVPGLVGMAVDMLMGTSTTEVYSGFKRAYESGQPIPGNEYAAFLLASSTDLARRKAGRQVALELGNEYASAHTAPGEILRQMNDGRFKARIEQIIARDEATAASQQQGAAPAQLTNVDKLNGARSQQRPDLGTYTRLVNSKASSTSAGIQGPGIPGG